MEVEQIKDEQKDTDLNESITRKKKIITSYDKNNEAYYSEMNSREPTTIHQSIDYYELLKQQNNQQQSGTSDTNININDLLNSQNKINKEYKQEDIVETEIIKVEYPQKKLKK